MRSASSSPFEVGQLAEGRSDVAGGRARLVIRHALRLQMLENHVAQPLRALARMALKS